MNCTDYLAAEDYTKEFDAKRYLDDCYKLDQDFGGKNNGNWMVKWLTLFHKVFAEGNFRGKKILELGAGPCIYTLISACKHYEQIVLSDVVEGNRQELSKWRNNDPDAFDWSPYFKIVCDLEGNGETVEERAETLREGIKDVTFCDVLQDPLLPSRNGEKYDAIISIATVEASASDGASRREIMARIINYLNPGGILVLGASIGSTFYRRGASGGRAFANYKTDREEVVSTLVSLGTKIVYESLLGLPGDGYYNDCKDRIFVVAQKCSI